MVLERHSLVNVYINCWVGPTLSLRTVWGWGEGAGAGVGGACSHTGEDNRGLGEVGSGAGARAADAGISTPWQSGEDLLTVRCGARHG